MERKPEPKGECRPRLQGPSFCSLTAKQRKRNCPHQGFQGAGETQQGAACQSMLRVSTGDAQIAFRTLPALHHTSSRTPRRASELRKRHKWYTDWTCGIGTTGVHHLPHDDSMKHVRYLFDSSNYRGQSKPQMQKRQFCPAEEGKLQPWPWSQEASGLFLRQSQVIKHCPFSGNIPRGREEKGRGWKGRGWQRKRERGGSLDYLFMIINLCYIPPFLPINGIKEIHNS